MIWFTSDSHCGHNRIIEYCNRPFHDSDHMDTEIICRFQEKLRPGDTLYHLGDVSWSSYDLDKFFKYFKNVHLIYGNHDKPGRTQHPHIRSYSDIKNLSLDGDYIVMCHYAMRSWKNRSKGAYHLYGHSHGKLPGEGRSMDVGVDTNNFYPYSWPEIKARLEPIPFFPSE